MQCARLFLAICFLSFVIPSLRAMEIPNNNAAQGPLAASQTTPQSLNTHSEECLLQLYALKAFLQDALSWTLNPNGDRQDAWYGTMHENFIFLKKPNRYMEFIFHPDVMYFRTKINQSSANDQLEKEKDERISIDIRYFDFADYQQLEKNLVQFTASFISHFQPQTQVNGDNVVYTHNLLPGFVKKIFNLDACNGATVQETFASVMTCLDRLIYQKTTLVQQSSNNVCKNCTEEIIDKIFSGKATSIAGAYIIQNMPDAVFKKYLPCIKKYLVTQDVAPELITALIHRCIYDMAILREFFDHIKTKPIITYFIEELCSHTYMQRLCSLGKENEYTGILTTQIKIARALLMDALVNCTLTSQTIIIACKSAWALNLSQRPHWHVTLLKEVDMQSTEQLISLLPNEWLAKIGGELLEYIDITPLVGIASPSIPLLIKKFHAISLADEPRYNLVDINLFFMYLKLITTEEVINLPSSVIAEAISVFEHSSIAAKKDAREILELTLKYLKDNYKNLENRIDALLAEINDPNIDTLVENLKIDSGKKVSKEEE